MIGEGQKGGGKGVTATNRSKAELFGKPFLLYFRGRGASWVSYTHWGVGWLPVPCSILGFIATIVVAARSIDAVLNIAVFISRILAGMNLLGLLA